MKNDLTLSKIVLFLPSKISIFFNTINWISGYNESNVVKDADIFLIIFFSIYLLFMNSIIFSKILIADNTNEGLLWEILGRTL